MFTREEQYYKLDHIIAGFIDIKQLIIQKYIFENKDDRRDSYARNMVKSINDILYLIVEDLAVLEVLCLIGKFENDFTISMFGKKCYAEKHEDE